jgi:hypothetical protein
MNIKESDPLPDEERTYRDPLGVTSSSCGLPAINVAYDDISLSSDTSIASVGNKTILETFNGATSSAISVVTDKGE